MNITKIFRTRSRIKFSSFISGFTLVFLLVWTVLPSSAAGIEADRKISAGMVYPGESFVATVHIKINQNVEALTLDEDLPDGWRASQLENNRNDFQNISTFKASTLEWIWTENLSAGEEKVVAYNVTVPSDSEPGNFTISGRVSAYSFPAVPVEGFSEVIVTYPLIEANFSANPILGDAPLMVQFTDLSSSNSDSLEWDFDGNGSIDSNERNPVYTYQNPGTYTVTLKATNRTYGNNSGAKTGCITVTEKPSISGGSGGSGGSSGSGGGGGGAGSPESIRNIELKEISNEQVFKGTHTCFTFKGGKNEIVTVEFDPKKSFGKTTAIVEMLKNTSSIVKEPAPETVYRNVNIWVGNSGFSSPENLENARINFRVSKVWITEQGVSENTVTLYRYSEGSWNPLPTTLNGQDEAYFYYTAETPGFSPFAISSTEKKIQSVEISPARTRENQTLNEEKKSDEEKQGIPASNIEKNEKKASNIEKDEKKSSPGIGMTFAVTQLMVLYGLLRKRK